MGIHQTAKSRRNLRSRSTMKGEVDKPRICVFRSNKQIYVQAIDDRQGIVLASASSLKIAKCSKSEKATKAGEILGGILISKKIDRAMFDRNGFKYHGRIKALADAIRSKGVNL